MNHRFTHSRLAVLLLTLAAVPLLGQTISVPRDAVAPGAPPQEVLKPFDTKHLADRPYTFTNPKPQFPSTDRVQREFIVEYVYDYALSRYTPEVSLPVLLRSQAKRDTPENAVTAFFSAMQTGDYDAWLACWDTASQADFVKEAHDAKHDAAYWKQIWSGMFSTSGKIVLIDRIETQNYIIFDTRVPGKHPFDAPVVTRYEKGQWKVTNDLQSNAVLTAFRPGLAGELNLVPPLPKSTLPADSEILAAQQAFIEQHNKRDRIIQVGR